MIELSFDILQFPEDINIDLEAMQQFVEGIKDEYPWVKTIYMSKDNFRIIPLHEDILAELQIYPVEGYKIIQLSDKGAEYERRYKTGPREVQRGQSVSGISL